jgi:hypothetical protein
LELAQHGQQQNNDASNMVNEIRWEQIKKMIKVDLELTIEKAKKLWHILENYADVSTLNKRELECCLIGKHIIDTHGFHPIILVLTYYPLGKRLK